MRIPQPASNVLRKPQNSLPTNTIGPVVFNPGQTRCGRLLAAGNCTQRSHREKSRAHPRPRQPHQLSLHRISLAQPKTTFNPN
jgi:hypothetical protein